ncbi:mannitol dehydrogenase family protein [Demequina lignilytica]|uniref:Mannitol-1-phosphate 5-dehydrogenase n=1 Tax=Demequina lignilytica TaxID=3051663 RepID=A0AB35MES8_9MICO|nr:mannitol dehydrogenase family protein [Demequina sp. SYSU T0a273]MDN4482271.1 mannitol dehydrogenase family protein [Demequina sp. SYSU T0a273]
MNSPTLAPLARRTAIRPIRMIHLGLGNFFRAHQAWYTDTASDAAEWGYAAFDGRSPRMSTLLRPQGGAYTLVTQAPGGDELRVVEALSAVHAATEAAAWLGYFEDPQIAIVTLTITEAGYRVDPDGAHAHEVAALRSDPRAAVASAVGRLVAGLLARRAAGAGGIVLLPCDNLPDNGPGLREAVTRYADRVDPTLLAWIDTHVTFGSTMVDRITPATTPALVAEVERQGGFADSAPVPTEPFTEWVIACEFPAGRPDWDATFVDDVAPYEHRKHWLLNGSHSLLAYRGLLLGHVTVLDAILDPDCRGWVERWWDEAQRHIVLDADSNASYRGHLIERYGNPSIRHELAQISMDGSEKLLGRVLPVVLAEREAGRTPEAALMILGAWVAFLRARPVPVRDPRADELCELAALPDLGDAARALVAVLDADLASDDQALDGIVAAADALLAAREGAAR